jgi:ATP-dependent helicase/nuclease subunit B
MLLFYEAINAATRRLWLSYPAVNEKGEPLTPSPYVKEVEQGCGATAIAREVKINLSPVPDADEVCSLDDFRLRAAADGIDGKPELLAGFVSQAFQAGLADRPNGMGKPGKTGVLDVGSCLLDGLEFSLARQDRERFGPSEGMLGEAGAKRLAADCSPDRVYSTTELESYAYCPYRYFLEKVLRVQPFDEIELEVDYAGRGRMVHKLLAVLHRRVNEARGRPNSPAELAPEEFARILDEAVAEAIPGASGERETDALREIDRRKVLEWLAAYREQHANYDEQLNDCERPPRPEFFEVSFGQALRDGQAAPSTAEPLEFTRGSEMVRLSGRIDRLDLGQAGGQTIFNIVDYKTGSSAKFSMEACQRGTVLQLPVYAMAAAELILNDRDALPWRGGYWYISGDGFKLRQALQMYDFSKGSPEPTETWEVIRGLLADTIVGLVKAMRRGEFPVWSEDEDCTGRCPYKTVCRINQIRSLGKKWRPS